MPSRKSPYIVTALHWLVLLAAGALIAWITRDTLRGVSFMSSQSFRTFQFWMCVIFQIDIIVEWCYAPRKWHYVARNILFILVSIPYMAIIRMAGISIPAGVLYALSFVPMVRAAFVFAIITGALTSSRVLSTFYVYLIWVVASLLFASLMFFEGEHYLNPQVDTYWTSLWWACMSMTTAGSNITPVTTTGNLLEVLLSAEGMMLIPVFTVYITRSVLGRQSPASDDAGDGSRAQKAT